MSRASGHDGAAADRGGVSVADASVRADQRDAATELLISKQTQFDVERSAMKKQIVELEERVEQLESARSLRLARAVADAMSSWRAFLGLPRVLKDLVLRARQAEAPSQLQQKDSDDGDSHSDLLDPTDDAVPHARYYAARRGKAPLRVLAILDELSEAGLQGECELMLPGPGVHVEEMASFSPDLLLVESAWRGNGGAWRGELEASSSSLLRVLHWCRQSGVPTVFWNKEDPVHFQHFLAVARHFDLILTTDADCVPNYRELLGRSAVDVFPFACQPRVHDPIHTFERVDAFCFAGSFYARYPERASDFSELVDALSPLRRIEIFDRNHGLGLDEFTFPERYASMVQGRLPPERISKAYKGYRYAINLNTTKASPTMFARRVFELMASGTVVISNRSLGMQRLFGDLVVTAADGVTLSGRVARLLDSDAERHRLTLLALRKVMAQHTWADRLAWLRRRVLGDDWHVPLPEVLVVARARNEDEVRHLVGSFDVQVYEHRRMLLVCEPEVCSVVPTNDRIRFIARDDVTTLELGDVDALACFHPDDAYGPGYLLDLALASRYTSAIAVGKSAMFVQGRDGHVSMEKEGTQYHRVETLELRSSLILDRSAFPDSVESLLDSLTSDRPLSNGRLLALDEFNYCRGAAGSFPVEADDGSGRIDQGLSISEFLRQTPSSISDTIAAE